MNKILIVTNIPTPYRIPLFNELKRKLDGQGMILKVIFGSKGYPRRKWTIDLSECRFDFEILASSRISTKNYKKAIFTYKGLWKILNIEKPDIIISSGFSFATSKLWLRSLIKETRYVIWSGAIEQRVESRILVRKIQRRILSSRACGYIAYGSQAKGYLESLGAESKKISIAVNTTDTSVFLQNPKFGRGNSKAVSPKKLLFVGHLEKGKRVDLLLLAVKSLLKRRDDIKLVLVGDGSEMERLEMLAHALGISRYVCFEGFKQKQQVLEYYQGAHCFLFPSVCDVWGLVLVEAMAAGVPCISSIHAGATVDLIEDGITGFKADFSQIEEVAQKIDWLLSNSRIAEIIGYNAYRFIKENASIDKSTMGFMQAIKMCLNHE